ncbi:tetratricopeptide repeat protein [Aromatoleum diolicum]|uniref:Tetratricopeptide repeat protein 38 n=1 Tax=Aromatoleum diolicum TaxID=75796 RepID=A0ABX1QE73_9RHOO|nr:tetratricopeptide repeat protein [Aromatoleum diolicum]NMG76593.1 tetratricopeptide repeat protein [Aromatoleum diolicum]
MTLLDRRGVSVSATSHAALERLETATDLFNGYFGDPIAAIDKALAEDPQFVMGYCFRAGVLATCTDKTLEAELRGSVEAGEALWRRANERERGHIAAARAWLDGDIPAAVERWSAVLLEVPRDSLALQFAHLGDFYLGQSSMLRDRVARVLPDWDEGVAGYGYVLGMHAFGLEETALYDQAEHTARRAVELNRRDPWAIHAGAHVMEMQGRQADGIRWLTERQDDWAIDNAFAFHNWWHLALYHLDLGDTGRVLELYDRAIRPRPSNVVLEMIDASALLWRLYLRGVDTGTRWHELAQAWAPTVEHGYYAFNDFHAMMAFVASGDERAAQTLLATLERRAAAGGTNGMMSREVGLPLCRALEAFGRGDHGRAVDLLQSVRCVAQRFGGSHAQRDIIHLTLVEAALRAGQGRLARSLVAERSAQKPTSPFNRALAIRAERAAAASREAGGHGLRAPDARQTKEAAFLS